MDNKNGKKKESIEDILSDLNGLLNKMPSILDGIKMPEIKPVDFNKSVRAGRPAPEPVEEVREPQPEAKAEAPVLDAGFFPLEDNAPADNGGMPVSGGQPPSGNDVPFDGDKTMVLEAFSGLEVGAISPAAQPAQESPFSEPPLPGAEAALPGDDQTFSAEGSVAGVERPSSGENAPLDADRTVAIGPLSDLPEGSPAAEAAAEELVPQSLGDFMFGENAEANSAETGLPPASIKLEGSPLEPPAGKDGGENQKGPLFISELTPPQNAEEKPAGGMEEASLNATPREEEFSFNQFEDSLKADSGSPENSESFPASGLNQTSDSAADFAIPDIDALIQLSEGKSAGVPDAAAAAEPAPLTPAKAPGPDLDDLAEFEKQLAAGLQQETGPEPEPACAAPQDFSSLTIEPYAPGAAGQCFPLADLSTPELSPETVARGLELEAYTGGSAAISPAPGQAEAPVTEQPETSAMEQPETPVMEQPETPAMEQPEAPVTEQPETPVMEQPEAALEEQAAPPVLEQAEMSVPQPETGGIVFENSSQEESSVPADSGEAIRLEPVVDASAGGIELSAPPDQEKPAPGNVIEFSNGASVEPQLSTPEPSSGSEPVLTIGGAGSNDDKTMVMPPPSEPGEGHVGFQAFVAAGVTSRAKMSDLAGLSDMKVPEGIPDERVRSLFFLYCLPDKALCATLLAELDSICLSSPATPMFIKRAGVKGFDTDMNANFIHQMVADSGAVGLVSVGAIPPENVSEIENAFVSSGSYCKHFDADTFSRSAVLDMLLELILR